MNSTIELPQQQGQEAKQVMLDAVDFLNLTIDNISMWMNQAKAISGLAMYEGRDSGYPIFTQTIESMAEILRCSMRDCDVASEGTELIIRLNKAAEAMSGVPEHS